MKHTSKQTVVLELRREGARKLSTLAKGLGLTRAAMVRLWIQAKLAKYVSPNGDLDFTAAARDLGGDR